MINMIEGLKITNSMKEIKDYFMEKEVSDQLKEKMNNNDMIVLPYKYGDGEYYYAQETINFLKYSRQTNQKLTIDILPDGDIKVRSLHSSDIWMPFLWIGSSIVLPLLVNLVSNYIWDKIRGREQENSNIHVTIMVQQGQNSKELQYNGDVKNFIETFEKIDFTQL